MPTNSGPKTLNLKNVETKCTIKFSHRPLLFDTNIGIALGGLNVVFSYLAFDQ